MSRVETIPSVPQLAIDREKSIVAPSNLFAVAVNGIARLEHFKRYGTEASRAREAAIYEKIDAKREATDLDVAEQSEIRNLTIVALLDPEAEVTLRQKESAYHSRKAEAVGSYVIDLETNRPRFSGLKTWLAKHRQSKHERKANKALEKLDKLEPNRAPSPRYHKSSMRQRRPE